MPRRPDKPIPGALPELQAPPPAQSRAGAFDLHLTCPPDKTKERVLAELAIDAAGTGMATVSHFNKGFLGEGDISATETYEAIRAQVAAVEAGDHSAQRALLVGQSYALNSIFTEMARRAANNLGRDVEIADRYLRLAFKAQAQNRATIEALDRIANGREQTVRHVHVDNRGGQAVIAETVHTGGQINGKTDDQSRAPGSTIDGCTALPSPDPLGNGVPVPSRKRKAAVPNARRHQ